MFATSSAAIATGYGGAPNAIRRRQQRPLPRSVPRPQQRPSAAQPVRRKLSYKEQRELAQLPSTLEDLERAQGSAYLHNPRIRLSICNRMQRWPRISPHSQNWTPRSRKLSHAGRNWRKVERRRASGAEASHDPQLRVARRAHDRRAGPCTAELWPRFGIDAGDELLDLPRLFRSRCTRERSR